MTNHNDLARRLAALFSSPAYVPLPERELAKALSLPPGQRGQLRQALRDLADRGLATQLRGKRWAPPAATAEQIAGTFRVRLNGTCWLIPDDPRKPTLKIDPTHAGVAMHGDRVIAVPLRHATTTRMFGAQGETRAGRVLRVTQRKRQWVVGTLHATPYYAYIVPRDALLKTNIQLAGPPAQHKKRLGNLVLARILDAPPSADLPLTAEFVRDLGDPEAAENDIPALLLDRGLSEEFPDSVQKAARRVPARLAPHHLDDKTRVDLRQKLVFTIDPATAHDYDDAISIESLPNGRSRLGIHIADVAAYVKPGSEIDKEAYRRGNSTYLVDRVIRMLPEDLTVRVCSLQPDEDHLAHTVDIILDSQGQIESATTYRSLIRSRACLSYEGVEKFFRRRNLPDLPAEVGQALLALRKLTRKMRALRFRQGALDFALPDVACILDAQGNPLRFVKRGATEAYHLIEECMLAANRVVAEKIFHARLPGIYRVHDQPSDEQWTRMAEELRFLGYDHAPKTSHDLNQLARKVLDQPDQHIATLTLLRNMKRAVYEAESRPHFGLGFTHYAHFTSPIRRYPDLVLHRVLIALETGAKKPAYTKAQITKMAIHCSATERESAELEMQSIQAKRIRYYAALLRKGAIGPYTGTIISLNPKGLIIELQDTLQQGLLPYHTLGRERYHLSPDSFSAATRKGSPFRFGQALEVSLAAVDEHLGRVDFLLDQGDSSSPRPPTKTKARKTRPKTGKTASARRSKTVDKSSPKKHKPTHRSSQRSRGSATQRRKPK
ncbi:MAG: VacB/RNase II family 3'-5' exoribonuclease [Lentisphaerae bacterium]|jgi:ribonuclease R|nr:VacB/RNase II family 3'-5' exoribonuclease [Lentisphaerota bacterium]